MLSFHKFREPIDEVELNRAKNILKMNILMALESQEGRTEEIAKNYMTFNGELTFN